MSPPRDKGAAPAVEMAMLDSKVNHLDERVAEDRKVVAERLIDLRNWRERIEQHLGVHGTQLDRLEHSTERLEADGLKQTQTLAQLTDVVIQGRATVRAAAWLMSGAIGVLSAVEVIFHLWGHR